MLPGKIKRGAQGPVAMAYVKRFPILAPHLADSSAYRLPAYGFTARFAQAGLFLPIPFEQLLHPNQGLF